jgi:hypothetical protein
VDFTGRAQDILVGRGADFASRARGKIVWIGPNSFVDLTTVCNAIAFYGMVVGYARNNLQARVELQDGTEQTLTVCASSTDDAITACDTLLALLTTCNSTIIGLSGPAGDLPCCRYPLLLCLSSFRRGSA